MIGSYGRICRIDYDNTIVANLFEVCNNHPIISKKPFWLLNDMFYEYLSFSSPNDFLLPYHILRGIHKLDKELLQIAIYHIQSI